MAATFQNAAIDKAEKSEFSNSARDMFKFAVNNSTKEDENLVLESSDVVDFFRNVIQPFLAEIRKNDQSRSTIGETTGKDSSDPVPQAITTDQTAPHSSTPEDVVDIINVVPPKPSSLPVTSIADRYTCSMLQCLLGYPLYNSKPSSRLSKEYPRNGVIIGDVGFVRGTGAFEFLFNICPSQDAFNPPNLPKCFSLETPNHSETANLEPLPPNTRLFQSPITRTRSGEYICEGSGGAVLELPKGAIQDEATNTRPFEKLAARNGVQWYEYTMTRGTSIANGSLYLITSVTKCSQWGIAIFDRPCAPGQGLKFDKTRSLPFGKSTSKYRWKGSDTFPTKVSYPDKGDVANQCVLMRGYKIMIRQDIFDNLSNDRPRRSDSAIPSSSGSSSMTRQRATRIRGTGAGLGRLFSRTTMKKSDEVALHPNFNSSLVHPSDIINAALLSQNPGVKVALTHDDIWCNLLRDNFPKLNYAALINIARSYTNTIEYGMQPRSLKASELILYITNYNLLSDSVSLEKISDPSNILEESSRPIQGTRTPVFQVHLTPSNDDYTPVPATISLPRELVERILLLLDTNSVLKSRLVSREFNAIIQSSTLVQYYLACNAAGVTDNPKSPLSYAERQEALKRREDAWGKLKPVFETTIKAIDQPSEFYELRAGNYFHGNGKDLYYCHLPSSPEDNPQWLRIPGHGPGLNWSGSSVGMGLAIYEHDLIVNVISSEVGNQADMQQHSCHLVLLKFSTGEYHPLARHPWIPVQRSPSTQPFTSVKIVGDNLALVVHDQNGSRLLIFDWKTGHKRLQHKATENAYDGSVPVFVSPELLLVPNLIQFHFEIWHLFPSYPNLGPPVQILSLQIPTVSAQYSIFRIYCHGELDPFLHSMPYFPPRPFFPSSEDSIIIVNLAFDTAFPRLPRAFNLIMHRHAILDMIQKWTSPSLLEKQQGLSTWFTNEVTVDKVADPDDGQVRLDAQSELVSTMLHPGSSSRTRDSPTLATSQISPTFDTLRVSADSRSLPIPSGSTSATSRYDILQVQWADWGPSISRWFQVNKNHTWRITQSHGQRWAVCNLTLHDNKKCLFGVVDFNLHNVRRDAEMMTQLRGSEGEDNGNNEERKKGDNKEGLEILDHEGVFSEEVYMGLKCVVHHAPGKYDFDAVLMDEERLLGLKIDREERRVESITVLYIG